ncbi:metacaspase 9 [Actinidia rufa]|uniref:Metacaspase 9 n=1 Tax=Actinidia rufa TaxID=165716 RepID=A0A7J0FF96_9ERIC|nr:metacaspase 9 [Actinidia rufa]
MIKKRLAVLVGCNYPNTPHELHGCINDVVAMREVLVKRFGFDQSHIELLTDAPGGLMAMPTGANIKKSLGQMVDEAEASDVLFFHFRGHGTRIPSSMPGHPFWRQDEAIVPCDFNLITDMSPMEGGGKAYGSFSNAIQIVLRENSNSLSNREIVVMARKVLETKNFEQQLQHPCLYCSEGGKAGAYSCVNLPNCCGMCCDLMECSSHHRCLSPSMQVAKGTCRMTIELAMKRQSGGGARLSSPKVKQDILFSHNCPSAQEFDSTYKLSICCPLRDTCQRLVCCGAQFGQDMERFEFRINRKPESDHCSPCILNVVERETKRANQSINEPPPSHRHSTAISHSISIVDVPISLR